MYDLKIPLAGISKRSTFNSPDKLPISELTHGIPAYVFGFNKVIDNAPSLYYSCKGFSIDEREPKLNKEFDYYIPTSFDNSKEQRASYLLEAPERSSKIRDRTNLCSSKTSSNRIASQAHDYGVPLFVSAGSNFELLAIGMGISTKEETKNSGRFYPLNGLGGKEVLPNLIKSAGAKVWN